MDTIGTWFAGYTLIDITQTGVIKNNSTVLVQRNQQRNWETVLQVISLRAQPIEVASPKLHREDITNAHEFGSHYQQTQHCWKFKFFIEHHDIFGSAEDPDYFLRTDFQHVPIIVGLTETASFPVPMFYTSGEFKNIYFKLFI
jgi:hypothetical protein